MNGAKADPSVKTIKKPNSNKNTTIGASHHFLRTFRKDQSSLTIAILLITYLLIIY
jgi:hypothetical protein